MVRIQDALAAKVALTALILRSAYRLFTFLVEEHFSRCYLDAALPQHSREEIDAANRHDQEEEYEHYYGVCEEGHRSDYRLHD